MGIFYTELLTGNHNGSILQNLEILASDNPVCAVSVEPERVETS
jgi:hypothetical protein